MWEPGTAPPQRRAPVTDLQPENVTFLFTDVEGSTRLWEAQPRAMSVALGDAETAIGLYRESHSLDLEGGNRLYAAIPMEGLATLTRLHGDEGIAQTRFREALLLYRSVGDKQGIASCLSGLATVAS